MKNLVLFCSLTCLLSTIFISCRDAKHIEPELIEDEEVAETENPSSGDQNSNSDGSWNIGKFSSAFDRDFGDWDNNRDHNLNSEEFYSSTFATTDASGDYLITEEEWNQGHKNVFRDFAGQADFIKHDVNRDNKIDHKEWTQAFEDSNWFISYDSNKDKRISTEEWKNGLFNDWDANKDKILDKEEFQAYNSYYK